MSMTDTQVQSITVLGPNLSAKMQAKGGFHFHAAGCADIKRNYSQRDVSYTAEYASVQEIMEDFWSDFVGDPYGELGYVSTWDEYLSDSFVAPCVKLPREKVAA
jgi:hypothetical protein